MRDKITVVSTEPLTMYQEKILGKTLYKVTSVFDGKFALDAALEDLTVRKILRSENSASSHSV